MWVFVSCDIMRLIIDKLGSGHDDIFLKVDVIPGIVKVADSYYVGDFLGLNKANLKTKVKALINYWIGLIQNIDKEGKVFLPFELCDEYVAGIVVSKHPQGFIMEYAHTVQLHGYAVSSESINEDLHKDDVVFEVIGSECLISEDLFFDGLEWSLKELSYFRWG